LKLRRSPNRQHTPHQFESHPVTPKLHLASESEMQQLSGKVASTSIPRDEIARI
jgi:hypothetical protein